MNNSNLKHKFRNEWATYVELRRKKHGYKFLGWKSKKRKQFESDCAAIEAAVRGHGWIR